MDGLMRCFSNQRWGHFHRATFAHPLTKALGVLNLEKKGAQTKTRLGGGGGGVVLVLEIYTSFCWQPIWTVKVLGLEVLKKLLQHGPRNAGLGTSSLEIELDSLG